MFSEDLARAIAARDLYRRRDGEHAPPGQLRARAVKYPHILEASDDGSGRIALVPASEQQTRNLAVYCADVGSVSAGRFGWARSKPATGFEETYDTSMPSDLVDAVCAELHAGNPVALGFECPLFVPVPRDQTALGRARVGEGNRSWSAGAGTGALATGLVQAAWVLESIRRHHPDEQLWFDYASFSATGSGLLVWEAFVTSTAKGSSHIDDAAIAIDAFVSALSESRRVSAVTAERPLSLIGAAAIWAGWSTDDDLLHASPLVIRAT